MDGIQSKSESARERERQERRVRNRQRQEETKTQKAQRKMPCWRRCAARQGEPSEAPLRALLISAASLLSNQSSGGGSMNCGARLLVS